MMSSRSPHDALQQLIKSDDEDSGTEHYATPVLYRKSLENILTDTVVTYEDETIVAKSDVSESNSVEVAKSGTDNDARVTPAKHASASSPILESSCIVKTGEDNSEESSGSHDPPSDMLLPIESTPNDPTPALWQASDHRFETERRARDFNYAAVLEEFWAHGGHGSGQSSDGSPRHQRRKSELGLLGKDRRSNSPTDHTTNPKSPWGTSHVPHGLLISLPLQPTRPSRYSTEEASLADGVHCNAVSDSEEPNSSTALGQGSAPASTQRSEQGVSEESHARDAYYDSVWERLGPRSDNGRNRVRIVDRQMADYRDDQSQQDRQRESDSALQKKKIRSKNLRAILLRLVVDILIMLGSGSFVLVIILKLTRGDSSDSSYATVAGSETADTTPRMHPVHLTRTEVGGFSVCCPILFASLIGFVTDMINFCNLLKNRV